MSAVDRFRADLETLIASVEHTATVEEAIAMLHSYDLARRRLDRLQAFPKRYAPSI